MVRWVPCKFFQKGTCNRDDCNFRHDQTDDGTVRLDKFGRRRPQTPPARRGSCKLFKAGKCTFGDDCKYEHEQTYTAAPAPEQPAAAPAPKGKAKAKAKAEP